MAVEVTTAEHGQHSGTVTIHTGTGWEVASSGYLDVWNDAGDRVAAFHRDSWRHVRLVEVV